MPMPVHLTERQKRRAVMRQFDLQLPRFTMLELLERLPNYYYRFKLYDHLREVQVLATVVAESFDYYVYRLNLHRQKVEMVICQRHNAVLPVWVLELDTGMMYQPAVTPEHVERPAGERKHRNREEVQIFVSQLIVGVDAAYQELAQMPARTRQWYLERRNAYLLPRTGRPWAS
jgi:hypothetical protein